MALMAGMMLAACDAHEEVVDYTLKIGNVFRMDGSIVPPEYHLSEEGQTAEAIGIVVAIGGEEDNYSALVMALNDLKGEYWYTAKTAETGVSTDVEAFNGKENTSTLLIEYSEDKELDPMGAIMASTYNAGNITGWHLPSVAEMKSVVKNRLLITRIVKALGGDDFGNSWYLTSTADGSSDETTIMYNWCIIMPEGRVVKAEKTESHKVRPFMIIR